MTGPMMVSLVGRMTSGWASQPSSCWRFSASVQVVGGVRTGLGPAYWTQATSGAKPSTCSASLTKYSCGIRSGK